MNLYETLGVERDATTAKVKAAFRLLAKDLHPDKGGDAEAFKKLSLACMVLKDKDRRALYDKTGEVDEAKINSDLAKISSVLLMLFDAAIKEGLSSRSDLDVIKEMKKFLKKVAKEKEQKVTEIRFELDRIQELADRISCKKGDRNLIGSLIKNKKKVLNHARVQQGQELRIVKLVIEELEAYSCLVEVAYMVDMYFSGGMTTGTTA